LEHKKNGGFDARGTIANKCEFRKGENKNIKEGKSLPRTEGKISAN
jgi:hypothetical protein